MKIVERAVIAVFAVALLFVIHQLVGILFQTHGWQGLDASGWASWVQAIGSIGTIAGAVFWMDRQHQLDRALAREQSDREEVRKVEIIEWAFHQIQFRLEECAKRRLESDLALVPEWLVRELRQHANLLGSFPVFEMPSATLISFIATIERQIEQICQMLEKERSDRFALREQHVEAEAISSLIDSHQSFIKAALQICEHFRENRQCLRN